MSSPPQLSVVIPVYTPLGGKTLDLPLWEPWVQQAQESPPEVEWLVFETFSGPQPSDLGRWLAEQSCPIRHIPYPCTAPQRADSFNQAVGASQGAQILLLFEDCSFSPPCWKPLLERSHAPWWGGFYKAYQPDSLWLRLSSLWQNQLRFRCFGHLVGTNGLTFPRSFWEAHPFSGPFLEDLAFSDQAKRTLGPPRRLPGTLTVSSRRYQSRGVCRALWLNGLILGLYRLGVSAEKLRPLYPPGPS